MPSIHGDADWTFVRHLDPNNLILLGQANGNGRPHIFSDSDFLTPFLRLSSDARI